MRRQSAQDYSSARGIFFVHRQREHIDPVDDRHRIGGGGLIPTDQHPDAAPPATRNAQFARQYAPGGAYRAHRAAAHHLLHPRRSVAPRFFTVQASSFWYHQTGERQTRLPGSGAVNPRRFYKGTLTGSLFVKPVLFIDDAANGVAGFGRRAPYRPPAVIRIPFHADRLSA